MSPDARPQGPAPFGPGVFVAGAATFALEILGPRYLGPQIGTSLSSMTAAISVVLTGAALGAGVAGRIADRGATRRAEGCALLLAAIGIGIGAVLARPAVAALPDDLPLLARALFASIVMLLPASAALGAVPILAARRAVAERPLAAGLLGRLSAIGTVGGVVGLFGGVALLARVPVTRALAGVSLALAGVGALLVARRAPPPSALPPLRRSTDPIPEAARPTSLARLSLAAALLGFAILALEVIAVRRVAARVGSSLEAWTAVLAVVLLGTAAGAAMARDGAPRRADGALVSAGAGALALIGLLDGRALDATLSLAGLPPTSRVFLGVSLAYGPAFVALGAVGPRLSRAAAGVGDGAGRRLARVSVLATLGALVGTLATSPWLLPALRSESALALASIAATIAVAVAGVGRGSLRAIVASAAPALLVLALAAAAPATLRSRPPSNADPTPGRVVFDEDGPYARVAVVELEGADPSAARVSRLSIDARVHGVTVPGAPLPPRSTFASVAAAVIDRLAGDAKTPTLLVLGGGVYAVPRAFLATHPNGRCQVIELDPAVNAAARLHLGLVEDARLLVREGDARAVLKSDPGIAPASDFLFVDAFGDVSIPWTLTTVEFAREAKSRLRPGGALLVNAIDAFEPGRLVAALHATLSEVFAHVEVVGAQRDDARLENFVFVASDADLRLAGLSRATTEGDRPLVSYAAREWRELARRVDSRPLTDDFAPVEDLVSDVVARTMGR